MTKIQVPQQLTGSPVEDLGALAEVDLRRLAGVELKDRRRLWMSGLETCEEAAHRGVRAGEAVAAHQGAVDGSALDSLTPPALGPLAMRLRERGDRGLGAHRIQVHGKLRIPGQRRGHVEPPCRLGGAPKLGQLAPTHQSGTRNGAVGIAQSARRRARDRREWPSTEAEIKVARASLFAAQALARDLIANGRGPEFQEIRDFISTIVPDSDAVTSAQETTASGTATVPNDRA